MSLKHALLGFISYAPMTGYELKQHFDRSIYYFWNANLSQIYPALNRMKEDGLLTMEVEYQEDRPNRKVYHMTDVGREELLNWLREPDDLPPIRVAFLVKVFFGGMLEKDEMLNQLRSQLELHQKQLDTYREKVRRVLRQNAEVTGLEREAIYWNLTLEMGIEYEEGWIEWCREAIKKIEERID
jgi:DNA-binding PadR family transcriptional regulator